MKIYDVAVVGGGAAGSMAAIRSGESGRKTILIERNDSIGRKILITGKGRCNITNSADIGTFVGKFGKKGEFLRSVFYKFFNNDLIDFFESKGLEMKTERQGRVFPATDSARSVVDILKKALADAGVEIMYGARITAIKKDGDHFELDAGEKGKISAKRLILATGGASYKATGSSGDGFTAAGKLGHSIVPLKAALVPLRTKEKWVKELQGLALENIRITFKTAGKKLVSDIGELMFTHFGVSGPLVLDMSGDVLELLEREGNVSILIDLKPGLSDEQLDKRLLNDFVKEGSRSIKNIFKDLLPKRLIEPVITQSGVDKNKRGGQVTQDERRRIIKTLKAFTLSVIGSLEIEEAMVTGGGVSTKEIDPRTMASRIVPGLYFAGEIIDGAAPSGGYNLQQAFSTGYLAGEEAAK